MQTLFYLATTGGGGGGHTQWQVTQSTLITGSWESPQVVPSYRLSSAQSAVTDKNFEHPAFNRLRVLLATEDVDEQTTKRRCKPERYKPQGADPQVWAQLRPVPWPHPAVSHTRVLVSPGQPQRAWVDQDQLRINLAPSSLPPFNQHWISWARDPTD